MPYNQKRESKVVRKHGRWKKKHATTAYFMAMQLLFETRERFEGSLKPMKGKKLRGIAHSIDIAAMGTLVWQWEDDARR
eukprot:15358395-Ditylum_brightwellii.AAC.1